MDKRQTFLPVAKPLIGSEEKKAVLEVLESGWISIGPKCREFEDELKKYLGVKHALSLNSCTAGLFLSLKALGVMRGDEVILPTYTFSSTANVIEHLGAKPVFVDSEKGTCNLDVNLVEDVVTEKTKAIIPVHFSGQPVDMDELSTVSKKYNLKVVEDAAHAIGAEFNGKKIGGDSDAVNFSFYATKNITTGDGGALTTNNSELAKKCELLRLHGLSKDAWRRYGGGGNWRYDIVEAGYKYNLTDIQAALGLVQIKKLGSFNKKRAELVDRYRDELEGLDGINLLELKGKRKSVHHLFPIFSEKRNKLIEHLKEWNIGTSVHFIPVHSFTYYKKKYGYKEEDYPVAWDYFSREVSLPLFNGMTEDDVDYVIDRIKAFR